MTNIQRLSAELSNALEPHLESVVFEPEQRIFREGEPSDCVYMIDEGTIRIELEREELDSDSVLGFVGAGEFLGELGMLDGNPRSASAYAEDTVKGRKLSDETLDRLYREQPQFAAAVYNSLGQQAAAKLRNANERLSDVLFTGVDPDVDDMVERSAAAQAEFRTWTEERVDSLLRRLAQRIHDEATPLAEATVEFTRMGSVADKAYKNRAASMGIYYWLAGKIGSGEVSTDSDRLITEFAAPVGVVFGLIPVTSPVATAIFKSLICLKSRNSLILSFNRATRGLNAVVGEMLQQVLADYGAPVDLVQWVRSRNCRRTTQLFFRHRGVALILATGGASMVKAAYSSGKPALGVGPGNAPVLICADADLDHAAQRIVASKSFDCGIICGAEQNLVVVDSVNDQLVAKLEAAGCAILNDAEQMRFLDKIVSADGSAIRLKFVGKSAAKIANACDIQRPFEIQLIVLSSPADAIGENSILGREKFAPVVSLFRVADEQAGMAICESILEASGAGHTAVIYSKDSGLTREFALRMPASRILANSPASQGICGWTSGLVPSLTLGCGTFGGNSTSDNVTFTHLRNTKRLAQFVAPDFDF